MGQFIAWFKRVNRQQTPSAVSVLIISVLLADIVLAITLGKKLIFPFSKTTGAYVIWLGTIISFATGYVFWPLSVAVTVLRAYLTRRKLGKLESTSIVQPLFNKTAETLDKLAVALPALGIECTLLVVLTWGLVWASHPPAPPKPGQLVISNYPGSESLFRIVGNAVAVYYRNDIGSTLSPVQALQLSGASAIQNIAVSHDEKRIYATDYENGLLRVIDDQRRLREVATIYVGKTAKAIALSADGKKLYVAVEKPVPFGKIHVFETGTLHEIALVENVGCPEDLFVPSKAPLLFVATQCGLNNDSLYVIDTRKDKVIRAIPGFAVGSSVIATRDGATVYVSTGHDFRIVSAYLGDTPDKKTILLEVSAMALTLDEQTLLVGTNIQYKGQTTWAIISLDARTGTRCANEPMPLEAPPTAIVIAPDGGLMA